MTEDTMLMTGEIVTAYVGHNSIAVNDIPNLIGSVHAALTGLSSARTPLPEPAPEPAVSVRASVKPDHLVCLCCGAKAKMLKRHLMTAHGLTPEQYRAQWGLSDSYPMVAATPDELATARAVLAERCRERGEEALALEYLAGTQDSGWNVRHEVYRLRDEAGRAGL